MAHSTQISDGPSGLVSGGSGITEAFFSSVEEIGRAESHVLYRDRRYGRWYVLKALVEPLRGNPFYEEWLYKEYSVGVSLDHPNIVRVESLETVEPFGTCIVMEWVEGDTLGSAAARGRSKEVLHQVLDAVDYCHQHGIYHHDLKPSNIIVMPDGRVKLIDFGLSDGPQYAAFKQAGGTLGFAAPEQEGGGHADHRADIYALGRLTDMLLPRRYPLAVRRALRKDPARRPQSVAAFRRLLFPVWPLWVVGVVLLLMFVMWTFVPSRALFPVELESGQTVYMRELSRVHRTLEVVSPGQNRVNPWPDGYDKPQGDMVLPATVRRHGVDWRVLEVADYAFMSLPYLTSVSFPDSLQRIGGLAFSGCLGLRDTLVIPRGLKSIGAEPFNDCARLTTLIWQARDCHGEGEDTVVKYSYFFRCMALKDVIVDTGVEHLPVCFVSEVRGLERLVFRGSTAVAVNNMAAKSHGLSDVVLPPQMRVLEHGAFYETAMDTMLLPDSLEIVGDYAFAYCDSLRVLRFGPKVQMVGNYSFTECSHLREVTCLAPEPPEVQTTAFFQLPPTAVLYVPEGSLAAYRDHPVWGQFKKVEALR